MRLISAGAFGGKPSDPFGYNARSGYYQDRETGLYLCQHRFYDPNNGRWLNRDPIGYAGGTNLYGYCAGGPVGAVDRAGLEGGDLPEVVAEMAADAADPDVFGDPPDVGGVGGNASGAGRAAATGAAAAAAALGMDPEAPEQVEEESCAVGQEASDWVQKAADNYKKLADKWHWHHLYPKYLGGPEDGPMVRLPAAAHQMITNEFRTLAPYGEWIDNPDRVNKIMRKVYEKLPLDPTWDFKIHFGRL